LSYTPYTPGPPPEGAGAKLWRILTHPISETVGANDALDKFAQPGKDTGETMAKLKGFTTGALEAITPGHIAAALAMAPELAALTSGGAGLGGASSVLGLGGVPSTIAETGVVGGRAIQGLAAAGNAAMAAESAGKGYKDYNDPTKSKTDVALDALNTVLGVAGGATAGRNYQNASKAVNELNAASKSVPNLIETQKAALLKGLADGTIHPTDEMMAQKFPELFADVSKNTGNKNAKDIFGPEGKPAGASPWEQAIQRAKAKVPEEKAFQSHVKATEKAAEAERKTRGSAEDTNFQVDKKRAVERIRASEKAKRADEAERKLRGAAEDKNLDINKKRETLQGKALEDNKKFDEAARRQRGAAEDTNNKVDVDRAKADAEELQASIEAERVRQAEAELGEGVKSDAISRTSTDPESGKKLTERWNPPTEEGGEGGAATDEGGVSPVPGPQFLYDKGNAKKLADKLIKEGGYAKGTDIQVTPRDGGYWIYHTSNPPPPAAGTVPVTPAESASLGLDPTPTGPKGGAPTPKTPKAADVPKAETPKVEVPKSSAKSAKVDEANAGADKLEQLLGDREVKLANGKGALPAEPPAEGPLVANTQPAPPTFRVYGDPETGAIDPLEKAGEEYGILKGLKKEGLGSEAGSGTPREPVGGRAGAGKNAAAVKAETDAVNPLSDQLLKLPADAQDSALKSIVSKFLSERGATKIGDETGAANPMLLARMAGAGVGGAYGYNQDPEGSVLGGLAGAAAGAYAPSLATKIPEVVPKFSEGLHKLMDVGNKVHNTGLLSPLSVVKKAAGDVGGLTTAAIMNPERAGDILRQFTTSKGRGMIADAFRAGFKGPEAEAVSGVDNYLQKPLLSLPGRTMGGLTKATQGVLGEAGFSVPEQRYYTLTAVPQTDLGKAAKVALNNKVMQHFSPFAKIGINRLERGFEFSPLGFTKLLKKGVTPEEAQEIAAKAALGTTAMAGTAALTPDNFVKDHPVVASTIASLGGPMGVPMMAAMAGKQLHNSSAAEDTWMDSAKHVGDAVNAVSRDVPGLRLIEDMTGRSFPIGFGRNYLSGYTNFSRPIAVALDPNEPDVNSKGLPLQKQLLNRMLSNIPFVRSTLERQDGSTPPTLADVLTGEGQ
jgi:hypothetical protein